MELMEKEILKINKELKSLDIKNPDLRELFQAELEIMQYKKDLCQKRIYEAEEILNSESFGEVSQKKNLIFATTEYNNIYIEKDLKSIPQEYYEDIIECLRQLQDGFEENNIQKGRQLWNNNKLSGLHELKPFKVRIFYRNLAPDMVYVLLVRMKKSDNSQLDREEAIIRNKQTTNEFERLKEEIKNPERKQELIEQNIEIYERVLERINQK